MVADTNRQSNMHTVVVELFITKTGNQPITRAVIINGRGFEQKRNVW